MRDLETGDIVTEKKLSLGELIEWKTQPGKLYVMEDSDKPLESWPIVKFDGNEK